MATTKKNQPTLKNEITKQISAVHEMIAAAESSRTGSAIIDTPIGGAIAQMRAAIANYQAVLDCIDAIEGKLISDEDD